MLGLVARTASTDIPIAWMIGIGVGVVFALYVAYKVGRLLLKLVLGVIALAVLAGAVWWFWLR